MSATFANVLVAILLLAANGFFVAAEFALVKSKGFRIDALADQNRFGARLTQHIQRNIEPYLACCQLGITMASLGLGWIGEPTVAALLTPVLIPARAGIGAPPHRLHRRLLVFSRCTSCWANRCRKTLAIREPEPVSAVDRLAAARLISSSIR